MGLRLIKTLPVVLSVEVVEDLLFRVRVKARDLVFSEKLSHDLGHRLDDWLSVHVSHEHLGLEGTSLPVLNVELLDAGNSDQEDAQNE